ncbi:VP0952 family biofilm-associated protein, partial [Vibrio parahaemolyticus]
MIFSTLQFFITTFLAVVCARAMSLSEGEIPVLALMIPALWLLPQGGLAGLVLLGAMMVFGATLSMQPIALSVGVLILFPLLMV